MLLLPESRTDATGHEIDEGFKRAQILLQNVKIESARV